MPLISRKGSGPGWQAFKGEFAALHNCTDRPIIVALVVGGEIERKASFIVRGLLDSADSLNGDCLNARDA
jgi:hypothetical protein